ncbi:MAG: ECF-type sigma factor [Acidobacteriota bacterium]
MSEPTTDISQLLRACHGQRPEALARLMPVVLDELRSIAGRLLAREPRGHSLRPTALVSELYLRWVHQQGLRWDNRRQFFAMAGAQIRRILIDHARWKGASKRTPITRPARTPSPFQADCDAATLLDLDRALDRLECLDPELRQLVDLRFFLGLSAAEAAVVLGVTERTVMRRWAWTRAWLYRELEAPTLEP